MDLDLVPVGIPDDLSEFGRIEIRLLQIQIDQGGRSDVRRVQDFRLDGLRRHAVSGGPIENMERGEIPFLRPPLLRPPGLTQDVRHPAEVFAGIPSRRPRVEEAVDLLLTVGQNVHDDQQIGKVEGGVPRVQRLEETAAHVEPLPELLPAVDGTVASSGRYSPLSRRRDTASVLFRPQRGRAMYSWFSSSHHPPRRPFPRSPAKNCGVTLPQDAEKERKCVNSSAKMGGGLDHHCD